MNYQHKFSVMSDPGRRLAYLVLTKNYNEGKMTKDAYLEALTRLDLQAQP